MSVVDDVFDELVRGGAAERIVDLVLAAMGGAEALEAVVAGGVASRPDLAEAEQPPSPSVYLTEIAVAGFRGIGPASKISFDPGPGLTVVVGRNGSGKSSFSDALEVALTGDSYRWIDKTADWKNGWRNLHEPSGAKVEARFQVEGVSGATTVHRSWDDDARKVDDCTSWAQHHGQPRADLAGLGWVDPLSLYRPLLSYSELGVIASTPSKIFDALSGVLGLEELVVAAERLRQARLEREKHGKEAKRRLKDEILPQLETLDDDRARRCLEALKGRTWDLDVVGIAATGGAVPDSTLGALAELAGPERRDIERTVERLRSAQTRVDEVAGTDAANASHLAGLLAAALEHHFRHGDGPCPVCGRGALDNEWQASTTAELGRLHTEAKRFDEAQREAEESVESARRLAAPRHLPDDSPIGLSELQDAVVEFSEVPDAPGAAAQHLENLADRIVSAYDDVRSKAQGAFSEAEEVWRPMALALAEWLETAGAAEQAEAEVKDINTAEKAAKAASDQLRSRRFEPISKQTLELWSKLRLQSNVELKAVNLSGSGVRRRVDLDVTVDGEEGAALGVVSQGEINCLALSLFFPRATMPESPFRFVVIDDPVQAMDPARVDGLAQVLSELGQTRQVIVFTHDDRLPESLRRLNLAFTGMEVTRRPASVVAVRDTIDPVFQYFHDAWAVAKDTQLTDGVAERVVPGMCRLGLEAAFVERARREMLGKGLGHTAVEDRISSAKKLTQTAALALFGDADEGGRVLPHLNGMGRELADVFRDCDRGAHKGYHGSLLDLVNTARSLAGRVR